MKTRPLLKMLDQLSFQMLERYKCVVTLDVELGSLCSEKGEPSGVV